MSIKDRIMAAGAAFFSEKGVSVSQTADGLRFGTYSTNVPGAGADYFTHVVRLEATEDGQTSKAVTIKSPYLQNVWVNSCVDVHSTNFAQVPFEVFNVETDRVYSTSVFPARLFHYVNPVMDKYSLFESYITWKMIRGECFWELILSDADGKTPVRIEVLNPDTMQEMVVDGDLINWKQTLRNGNYRYIDPKNVIHFKRYNPFNKWRGISPLTAAALGLNIEHAIQVGQYAFRNNDSTPRAYISTDQRIDPSDADNLEEKWKKKQKGPKRKGEMPVLGKGAEIKTVAFTAEQSQLLEERRWNRGEVLAATNTPPALVNSHEDSSTWANVQAQLRQLFKFSLIPDGRKMNSLLATNFFDAFVDSNVRSRFNYSEVEALQDTQKEQAETAKAYVDAGFDGAETGEHLGIPMTFVGKPANNAPAAPAPIPSKAITIIDNKDPGKIENKVVGSIWVNKKLLSVTSEEAKEFGRRKIRSLKAKTSPIIKDFRNELQEEIVFQVRKQTLDNIYARTKGVDLKQVTVELVDELQPDWNALDVKIQEISTVYYAASYSVGAKDVADAIDRAFDIANPRAVAAVERKAIQIVEVNNTIKRQITDAFRPVIKAGIENGLPYNAIAGELAEATKNITQNAKRRMSTVAKTEINSSLSEGRNDAIEQMAEKKMWLYSFNSGADARVEHAQMHTEVVSVRKSFSNGLMYPHDPAGSAEEVINCGCIHAPAE